MADRELNDIFVDGAVPGWADAVGSAGLEQAGEEDTGGRDARSQRGQAEIHPRLRLGGAAITHIAVKVPILPTGPVLLTPLLATASETRTTSSGAFVSYLRPYVAGKLELTAHGFGAAAPGLWLAACALQLC